MENRFIFLEGEIPHMESRRHGVCEEIVLDITQGNIPPTENAEFVGDCR